MQRDLTVSIIGKDELVREGVRRILSDSGLDISCAVATPSHLPVPNEQDERTHIVLCDTPGGAEAIGAIQNIRLQAPDARIVVMVDEFAVENVGAAFGEGVDGYVIKGIGCEPLVGVLNLVATGEKVFPSQMALMLSAPVWNLPSANWDIRNDVNLSDREIEILRCLMNGDGNKVIARRLDITEATVKVHVKAVLRKLGVQNRTQAAVWAITRGVGQEERRTAQPELDYQRAFHERTRPQLRVAS